jgi:histo-blood group ABO system transferase
MSKVGLLIIATNKYIQFLKLLIESADKYFLPNQDVTYFIFTNQSFQSETAREVIRVETEHRDWPWMTLGRYKIFSDNSEMFPKMDYLYYCDADMRFEGEVGDEILGNLVATQHHGYYMQRGTPETNPISLACVHSNEEMQYFAGGFNGGTSVEYLKMSKKISNNIDIDYSNGIIAIWHDESHMNRYFIDNKPTKILNPSYCFYEQSNDKRFQRKLIALQKLHDEIRK